MHSVEIDNVCALLRCLAASHSDQYIAQELKRYCLAFILKNFDQVAYTTAFDELSSMPSLLLDLASELSATKDTVPRNVGCSSGSSPGM
eukprot:Skav229028  [mRNA]  locus=scaffold127:660959:661943:- [translate_table: standard]